MHDRTRFRYKVNSTSLVVEWIDGEVHETSKPDGNPKQKIN